MAKVRKVVTTILITLFLVALLAVTVYADEYDAGYEYGLEYEQDPHRMQPPSRVIITDFWVDGGGLAAGETSAVVFALHNTGVDYVYSVILTGWIEPASPVTFTETNQIYVGSIAPFGETFVTVEYFTSYVDLTALRSVPAGFTINYADTATDIERTNSVTVLLPVVRGLRTAVYEGDMQWDEPHISQVDEFLTSSTMQAVYLGIFTLCAALIMVLLLFKAGILKRKLD